jgi:hypothetical protein
MAVLEQASDLAITAAVPAAAAAVREHDHAGALADNGEIAVDDGSATCGDGHGSFRHRRHPPLVEPTDRTRSSSASTVPSGVWSIPS